MSNTLPTKLAPRFLDLTGIKFGRLEALSIDYSKNTKYIYWLCKCDCGKKVSVKNYNLLSGNTKSCRCLSILTNKENKTNIKHGLSRSKEYKTWCGMKTRCYNPNDSYYNRYGGRGIKVCGRWLNSFENFLEDMGKRPSPKHSIDRINNDGDYEPSNCKWATGVEQIRNRSISTWVEVFGENKPLFSWAKELNIKPATLAWRIRQGKKIENMIEAISLLYKGINLND